MKCIMDEGHAWETASNLSCCSGTAPLKPMIALVVFQVSLCLDFHSLFPGLRPSVSRETCRM